MTSAERGVRNRRPTFLWLVAAMCFAMPTGNAQAQIGFESFFDKITDVDIYGDCWSASGAVARRCSERTGYGVEVLFDLGNIYAFGSTTGPGEWADSTRETRCSRRGCETVTTAYRKPGKKVANTWIDLEAALNYSQFTGFESADARYKLTGSVREVPGMTIYATLEHRNWGWLNGMQPYIGIRSGLIQLNYVQLLDSIGQPNLTPYQANSVAFQIGGAIGLAFGVDSGRVNIFVERSGTLRRFDGVQWVSAGKASTIPAYLPATLDFSGPAISAGIQVKLR